MPTQSNKTILTELGIDELIGISEKLQPIVNKIKKAQRIDSAEALQLYKDAPIALLANLASQIKERISGNTVYYNRNIHLEPSNICTYNCKFCAYSRRKGDSGAWDLSIDEIKTIAEKHKDHKITEIHITGGAHPDRDTAYYAEILRTIKSILPNIHLKAFSAAEILFMAEQSHISISETLSILKSNGLDSLPGGGAEIFNKDIRNQLCPEKIDCAMWVEVHRQSHQLGIQSNATMLYGHIESYEHRIEHMEILRNLQDETKGFNAFIPLKYRKNNNELALKTESGLIEDMRNYAVARIFIDNIAHIKAYWPMIGFESAQLALSFGADDLDGTVDETTSIYSMAGVKHSQKLSVSQIETIIRNAGREPVERDSLYNPLGNII